MKKDVVFIDDVIKEGSGFANDLKQIVDECGLNLRILNTKDEIDNFTGKPPGKTGMVLLDRDLSKIKSKPKMTAKGILEKLENSKLPVFILSQHKPSEKIDEHFNELYALGAIDYIHKDRIKETVFMKNFIYSAVEDVNNDRFKLVIDCRNASITLFENDHKTGTESRMKDSIDYGDIGGDWKEAQIMPDYTSKAKSSKEILLRMLYEMGKRNSTKISIKSIYLPFPNKNDKKLLNKTEAERLAGLISKLNDYLLKKKQEIRECLETNYETGKIEQLKKNSKEIDSSVSKLAKLRDNINLILDEIYKHEDEKKKKLRKEKLHIVFINDLLSNLKGFADGKVTHYADEIAEVISGKITLPNKFSDTRIKLNNKIKDMSEGRVVGSVLMGEQGCIDYNYTVNIGKVELANYNLDEASLTDSWKDAVEKRLDALEKEVKESKKRK
jgi:hypothetical protein